MITENVLLTLAVTRPAPHTPQCEACHYYGAMPVDLPRDAIVIRFTPRTPEKILERAERDHRLSGRYALSVFADTQRVNESRQDTLARLLAASELSAIDAARNPKRSLQK